MSGDVAAVGAARRIFDGDTIEVQRAGEPAGNPSESPASVGSGLNMIPLWGRCFVLTGT